MADSVENSQSGNVYLHTTNTDNDSKHVMPSTFNTQACWHSETAVTQRHACSQPCVSSSTLSAALRQQQSAADVTTLYRCVTWQTSGSPSRKKQLASTISTGMRWKRTAGYASRIPVITVSTSTICRQRNGVTSRTVHDVSTRAHMVGRSVMACKFTCWVSRAATGGQWRHYVRRRPERQEVGRSGELWAWMERRKHSISLRVIHGHSVKTPGGDRVSTAWLELTGRRDAAPPGRHRRHPTVVTVACGRNRALMQPLHIDNKT